ncbi:type II secretion system F family protein [Alphaproteobacteria bacterium KMM 3653]|uniref:Type II secretion system F family protein n=1 Tax=Harenicola maris TaxID=2841044 RepID=A0AAP2CN79_9RHOB|nr:type II secretion system F family protein [Harenicola maris]
MEMSFTSIWLLVGISAALLGPLGLRLILAPENAQERRTAARIRAMQEGGQSAFEIHLLKQSMGKPFALPFLGDHRVLLSRAGLVGKGPLLGLAAVGLSLAAAMAISLPLGPAIGVPAGIALGLGSIVGFIKMKQKRRADLMTSQLPDALDLMMRGLRVGHPVSSTIQNVGRTVSDPIGAEFRQLSDQIALGDYLTDAFTDMAERVGLEDVEYLAVSLRIQHGTGGNLAEMLETLSKVVRDRIVMRRRVKAVSAEGRMSAYILSALPVFIYVSTSLATPDYYAGVADDPMYAPMMLTIVGLVVANFLALRSLVNFEM